MRKKSPVEIVVANAIGIALFFVIGRFIAVPSPVPNTNISFQYAILALFATVYGPVSGFIIGLAGHVLIDLSFGGLWWNWIIASAVFGLIVGLMKKNFSPDDGEFGKDKIIKFNLTQVIAHAISWILIAPVLGIVLFGEPKAREFLQGITATIINGISTGIVGTLLIIAYSKTQVKSGSLEEDHKA